MKKDILDTFIKKYNLGGNIENIKLVVDGTAKELRTCAITGDGNMIVDVKLCEFTDLTDTEIGIFDTDKLKKILGVLGDEISITLNTKNNSVTSISFKCDKIDAQFVTADLSVIPKSPSVKKLPEFNAEIEFDSEFINKFIKAKNALNEVDNFTLMMNKKNKLELVIGHSLINSNKIVFETKTKNSKDSVSKQISFSANYLKDILTNNNDCDNTTLSVSDAGLAYLSFVKNNFVANYYLVSIKNSD